MGIATYTAAELAEWAERLNAHEDYLVLRRLAPIATFQDANGTSIDDCSIGIVVDVETTGLKPATDKIIEIAIQRFRYNSVGEIVEVGTPRVWREDPGIPLDPFTTKLTGLTDADLAGQRIDEAAAVSLLTSAKVLIAHNAAFDRPFIERRLPAITGKAWGCSLVDLDWFELGFEGRKLSQLLAECGWFYDGHRAENDILALLHLLAHRTSQGDTILCKLLECAERPTWRVTATHAPFECKDQLKGRGYRWNGDGKCWWKDVLDSALAAEKDWLATEVYPSGGSPEIREINWLTRYS